MGHNDLNGNLYVYVFFIFIYVIYISYKNYDEAKEACII